MKMQLLTALGALSALALLGVQPAYGQAYSTNDMDRVSGAERVSYSDLDLSTESGASAFLTRIERAAKRACGYDRREHWVTRREAEACTRDAMNTAVASVDSPAVATRYASMNDSGSRTILAAARPAPAATTQAAATTTVAASTVTASPAVQLSGDAYTNTARVAYADLDLSSERGRAMLERRVSRATRQVCGAGGSTASRLSAEQRACLNEARREAGIQVASIISGTQYASAATSAAQAPSSGSGESSTAQAASPQVMAAAAQSSDGYGICAARTHNASFVGNATTLSSAERLEIGYAVDSASVCNIERVSIAANRGNATAVRRANALRAALIARGVPAAQVVVEHTDDASALGNRVQMSFSGVAQTARPEPTPPAGV